jgi:signal transduction histidine kinase
VDLAAVARESALAMQKVFGGRKIAFSTRVDVDVAPVIGDHDRLVQVLINLLGNAAKFAPEDKGRAELSLRRAGESYEVVVADNGPGVPAADREIVFERFRQLGDTMNGKPEGAGLGLAISQRIVAQHGGRIWVEESALGGAAFKVSMKALVSEPVAAQ